MTLMPPRPIIKKQYRPCVGIALFHQDGRVFVGERMDTPGSWQMPQGGIDPGEDLPTAAFRELLEETGISDAEILRIADKPIRYEFPETLRRKLWKGKFHGQEQQWVAMRFHGSEQNIDLNQHHQVEFSAWQWVDLPQTLDLIVPFKRDTYSQIIDLFSDLA